MSGLGAEGAHFIHAFFSIGGVGVCGGVFLGEPYVKLYYYSTKVPPIIAVPIKLHHVEKTADTQYSKQNLPTNQDAVFHQIQTN